MGSFDALGNNPEMKLLGTVWKTKKGQLRRTAPFYKSLPFKISMLLTTYMVNEFYTLFKLLTDLISIDIAYFFAETMVICGN